MTPTFDNYLTYTTVDLDAFAENVRNITAHLGDAELIAVVKANAYGHGAVPCSREALANGATRLAVGRVAEGVALRRASIKAPIMILSYTMPDEAAAIAYHDLTPVVMTVEMSEKLSALGVAHDRRIPVHVKVDTGMGRYGVLPHELIPFVDRISALPGIEVEGVLSHFATADSEDGDYTAEQFAHFKELLDALEAAGHHIPMRHIANSAAALQHPETHLDAARVGVALYGLSPSPEIRLPFELKPVLSLKSHVARVRTLPAGSSISYGRTHITERAADIALVPIGYGDGYHRALSNRGAVLIHGRRAPIVGRVCMDQLIVDVSGIDSVSQNDDVILIGPQGDDCISADELGALADTINYEVTTGLLPRVPRLFMKGDEVVDLIYLPIYSGVDL